MDIIIHQTHQTIADFKAIGHYLKSIREEGLHVFPELYLTGYPLQDLCLQRSFITKYHDFLDEINEWSIRNENSNNTYLMGGLEYEFGPNKVPKKIFNVVYQLIPGKKLKRVYRKVLLPNYDIFDESKYFSSGDEISIIDYFGKKIAILICEDMWPSTRHCFDPVEELNKSKLELDLIINLSASPYNIGKQQKRVERACQISTLLGSPFVYVNKVGAEDEIIFDGQSFLVNGDKLLFCGKFCTEDKLVFELPQKLNLKITPLKENEENTWESLFAPQLLMNGRELPTLKSLSKQTCQELIKALGFGLQDYARKNGFNKFSIALSGGVDSALVLAIIKKSLLTGQSLEAVYMPGHYSRQISRDLSLELCRYLEIPFYELPIIQLHDTSRKIFKNEFKEELSDFADENIQSRMRGALIYARSNQQNSLVFNTSNKSELAVGYSTLYGDSVGALSILGDLYKSEVYQLANYFYEHENKLLPLGIIQREPSAELRPDQIDTDSLPPYKRLDAILEGLLSYRLCGDDLISMGFSKEEVQRTINLYKRSEFKRGQFCPILKVKAKSFGFGYRVPISVESSYLDLA